MQAPHFYKKMSLNQIAQNKALLLHQQPIQTYQNHITWEERNHQEINHIDINQNNHNHSKRRKIFQKFTSKYEQRKLNILISPPQQKQKSKQKNKLKKIKSNPQVRFTSDKINNDPDERIQQINMQLKLHRQNLASSRVTKQEPQHLNNNKTTYLAKIQQKLAQSKEILQRQELILSTKIPNFQKKIQDNNVAINEVTKLIKQKFVLQNQKVQNLLIMMQRNQERLKNREEELSKINSQLLLKQSQIMKNKEFNKRSELQLLRIKRIQDLQKKNLQIYQLIQKKEFSQFQDFNLQDQSREKQGKCWGESQDESQVMVNKLSTIHYTGDKSNHSQNDTIGQLLSPLALSQNKYVI